MISTKGRYALRVMINIAVYSNNEFMSLKDIAAKENISLKYLEQVVALLTRANLLQSLRGNNGGYRLTKPAKDITAGDILRAAEGTLSSVQCLATNFVCPRESECSTIDFWRGFDNVVFNYVDSITLEKLKDDYLSKQGSDYSI